MLETALGTWGHTPYLFIPVNAWKLRYAWLGAFQMKHVPLEMLTHCRGLNPRGGGAGSMQRLSRTYHMSINFSGFTSKPRNSKIVRGSKRVLSSTPFTLTLLQPPPKTT